MPNGQNPGSYKDFAGGINLRSSPMDVAPNECLEAINCKFFKPDGAVSPRAGRRWMVGVHGNAVASSLCATPIGLYQYTASAGSTFPMVATCSAANISAQIGFLSGNSTDGALFTDIIGKSTDSVVYTWNLSMSSHATANANTDTTFVVTDEIPEALSTAGNVRFKDIGTGDTSTHAYSGWSTSGSVNQFWLEAALSQDYDGSDTATLPNRQPTRALSSIHTWLFSADHVCMTSYENHLLATMAYSSDHVSCTPPILWDGAGAGSAMASNISSEPLLGPDDDQSGTSADRLISTMIGMSAKYCGDFKGYLFFLNTVEHEMTSSDGSGGGVFDVVWHPYRLRWNNPAASSVKTVEESGGGAAWDYVDYIDLSPGDGRGITGFGVAGDEMLVFKRDKSYTLSWVGGDLIFDHREISDRVGCISHRSVVTGGAAIAWAAIDGIYYYEGQPIKLSDNIDPLYNRLNTGREMIVTGEIWPEIMQAWWSLPIDSAETNNQGIIYDFNHGDPRKECWSTATVSASMIASYRKTTAAENSGGIWATDYNGWPYIYDSGVAHEVSSTKTGTGGAGTKASGGFEQSWKSRWIDFDQPDYIKRIKQIKTVCTTDANAGHLSVDVRKNWEATASSIASAARQLSGRAAAQDYFLDKCNFTAQGQAFQLHYHTSAGPGVTTGTPSSHNFTIHDINPVYDVFGTVLYGDY